MLVYIIILHSRDKERVIPYGQILWQRGDLWDGKMQEIVWGSIKGSRRTDSKGTGETQSSQRTLSNLVSLIKNDADEEIDITSKSSNKFRYQANRAFIIGRIKIIFPKILCDLSKLSVIEKLYKEAVRCRSQILPGRSFPRKKLKSKGRSHFRNKKAAL